MKRLPRNEFISPALIWKRIAAFAIDMLIIILVIFIPFRKFFESIIPSGKSFTESYSILSSSDSTQMQMFYFGMSILVFFYFYKMENRMGQTIGKKLMNLYVVSDLKPKKRWQILVRNLMFIPIFPFDILVLVDPLFMFFTKSNQRLSEILGKTRVVEISKLQYTNE